MLFLESRFTLVFLESIATAHSAEQLDQ